MTLERRFRRLVVGAQIWSQAWPCLLTWRSSSTITAPTAPWPPMPRSLRGMATCYGGVSVWGGVWEMGDARGSGTRTSVLVRRRGP